MRINPTSLLNSVSKVTSAAEEVESAASVNTAPFMVNLVNLPGLREALQIHRQTLSGLESSGVENLLSLAENMSWASRALQQTAVSFDDQEGSNTRGLDIADAGGAVGEGSVGFEQQPTHKNVPISYTPPIVNTGASLDQLLMQLGVAGSATAGGTAPAWTALASTATKAMGELQSIAGALQGENDSLPTTAAAEQLNETATALSNFAANASQIAAKNTALHAGMQAEMPMVVASIAARDSARLWNPALAQAIEVAALQGHQATLQALVNASMPTPSPLTSPVVGDGGGSVNTGLDSVAGDGNRYTTEGVQWPEQFVEAVANGNVGPGNFDVVNGEIVGLRDVGNMPQSMVDRVLSNAQAHQASLYDAAGIRDLVRGGIDAANVATQSATAGLSGGGVPTGVGGMQGFGSTPIAGGGVPANAGVGGVGIPGGGAGAVPGAGPAGVGAGALAGGGAGAPGMMGGATPLAAGPGGRVGGAGATGVGGLRGGLTGGPGAAGVGGASGAGGTGSSGALRGGASGTGAGALGPGAGGAGGTGTGTSTHSSTAMRGGGSGSGANSGMRGGMVPAMAANRAGGGADKRVKTVTSRVESDPNREALLGTPPAVVPGVIGSWAREQE